MVIFHNLNIVMLFLTILDSINHSNFKAAFTLHISRLIPDECCTGAFLMPLSVVSHVTVTPWLVHVAAYK